MMHASWPKDELPEVWACEQGQRFRIQAYHRGQDPQLFLDLRVARRFLRQHCAEKSVLNLFSYTCGAGIAAEGGGAQRVVNVDFSQGALEVGRSNSQANGCSRQEFWCEEVYPVLWQLGGKRLPGRAARRPQTLKLKPQTFDVVVLDPPALSKGYFGAVDVERDYPGLLRPCFQIVSVGGCILACNNLASVSEASFRAQVERSAVKQGRTIVSIRRLIPEADFPARDDDPALKILVVDVA